MPGARIRCIVVMKDTEHGQGHVGSGFTGKRQVKGPAGIGGAAAAKQGRQRHNGAENVKPPGQQVEARKGHVPCADLQRQQEVAEGGRNPRDDEQKDHDHPMQGEQGVVGLRSDNGAARSDQFQANQQADGCADGEEGADGVQVKQPYAFVIGGKNPVEQGRLFA
jgi:hypothetical protein